MSKLWESKQLNLCMFKYSSYPFGIIFIQLQALERNQKAAKIWRQTEQRKHTSDCVPSHNKSNNEQLVKKSLLTTLWNSYICWPQITCIEIKQDPTEPIILDFLGTAALALVIDTQTLLASEVNGMTVIKQRGSFLTTVTVCKLHRPDGCHGRTRSDEKLTNFHFAQSLGSV